MGSLQSVWQPAFHRPRGAKTVVVAEDDADLRELIAEHLEEMGYEVIKVRDGEALLDELMTWVVVDTSVDLVLCDVRMPGMTGLEVLRAIRRGPAAVPVLFLTAFPDSVTYDVARKLGAVGVLDKPVNLDDLAQVVEFLVGPPRGKDGDGGSEASPASGTDGSPTQ